MMVIFVQMFLTPFFLGVIVCGIATARNGKGDLFEFVAVCIIV